MAKEQSEDPSMAHVRERFEKSGLTLHELGVRMGYPEDMARKSAWQFIRQSADPRVGTLRRFAKALGVKLKDLL